MLPFIKHYYAKPDKKKRKQMNDYDPRPQIIWGTASLRLPELLDKVKRRAARYIPIIWLFDPQFQCEKDFSLNECQPQDVTKLKETKKVLKHHWRWLHVKQEKYVERNTHEQRNSQLCFSVRRYCITSSLFRAVLSRKDKTPPESLVLTIISLSISQ